VPSTALKMKEDNDYSIERIKTWYKNPKDIYIKQGKANKHFDEVATGDAVLIVNDNKPGQPSYIGPNTMMEWGLAYYLKKPVYLLNSVDKNHNAYEEALGMTTAILDGDLSKIKL
jgi:nucleoside 2-deoxyribosyltransferase